ncbi:MAG: FAD-dependent oxidoreductase, partial [Gemmatimonadota bacterium]|nr:FAD-dependent oxidoreductase [Gemmatimonadota bacterium]
TGRAILDMMKPGSPLHIKPTALPGLRPWLKRFRSHCREADYRHGLQALASLNAHTFRLFEEWQDAGVEFEYRRDGLLVVFRRPDKLAAAEEETRSTTALTGTPCRTLTAAELVELEPTLQEGLAGGLFLEGEAHVRPESLTRGIHRDLVARGVEVREQERVTGLRWDGDHVRAVETEGSAILVDAVVLAAGAETGPLAAWCEWSLPITAGKGYSVTFKAPPSPPRRPLYLGDAKVGITPFAGTVRAAGTMELSGVNRDLDSRRLKSVRKAIGTYIDLGLDGATMETGGTEWVGMRPMVPDTLPVMGQIPGRPNVYVSTGHQMLGVTLSAVSGWALAGLILDGRPPLDLAPFSPARF